MIFLKRIHVNMIISSNFLEGWSFPKGLRRDMIFLILSGKMVLFPKNMIFSPWAEKWETIFLRKYMEIWHFLCTRTSVTNVAPRPSAKKEIKDGLIPQKYILHPKVIEVLDWHPRKSSSNSLSFHGDLYRRFHALFSSEKKAGNLIYRIEVWLLLNLFCGRYSTMINLWYFIPLNPQELCLEVCFSANKLNYFSIRR